MSELLEVAEVKVQSASEAPKGPNIYYRCLRCSGLIPSQPDDNIGCECGDIFIDIDYFRLVVRDFETFEVVRLRKSP